MILEKVDMSLLEGGKNMDLEEMEERELSSICGGEYISAASIMALMSVLAILVACYKMYTSTKGKATLGPSYSFEWA